MTAGDGPCRDCREVASTHANAPGAPRYATQTAERNEEPTARQRRRRAFVQRDLQPDVRSDWDEVRRELDRCRRYGRTFALVSLPECDHATAASLLRVVDRVWEDADAVYALLPESSASDAARLIGRLHREAPALAEGATFAAFPQDGMTMRALVNALADRRPDPAESPVAAALGARLRERRPLAIAGDVSAAATAPASSNGRARDSR